ncbi:hypothetical protein PDESU_02766 [Pontiella desulfatans]|uniref:CRISPR-associated protein Csd1 n=1 Tax=Pontiella desulfatans TaxID=2750659 RepID=A0A6C2U2X2_PONDE|nr:type I-C CRISPR-associated protein Cas8c/Csd1 [Pontiella desulfatans]VGO14207.1 hypothetical protein PDESU_02766 [Pontiella desulfatans]
MSWMQKLYETANEIEKMNPDEKQPWPIAHMAKVAHVEIILNHEGKLRNIRQLSSSESVTIIPVTEESANRTRNVDPHPLCEELGYCAKDLPDRDPERYGLMKSLMEGWLASFPHPKVAAVFNYLEGGTIYSDIEKHGLIPLKTKKEKGSATKIDSKKVFVRWRVESSDDLCSGTWEDETLINSWQRYDASTNAQQSFCMLSGEMVRVATKHSRFLRAPDDGAKLISSNDNDGYTYLGRFTDSKDDAGKQCCTVGYVESQKAHNALRWLISRQGYRISLSELGLTFLAWAVSGKEIPDPTANSLDFLGVPDEADISEKPLATDVGQNFALRLRRKMAGYAAGIRDSEDIVVMGLDSASKGRLAIIYYRELTGSEFLRRVEQWHHSFAWTQNFGKDRHFIGAPAPKEIAWAAFGRKVEGKNGVKLLGSTVERLFPCIIDGAPLPRDLMVSSVRRVSNRPGLEHWEWEKCLGIACSLFKGIHKDRSYKMELEDDRNTKDYLYGRLLAVAERIESTALWMAKESRDTTAARLMQRFADRPFSTWRTIETALVPYMSRIQTRMPGLRKGYDELLDEIHVKLNGNGYTEDTRLTGEYLLGYHCQRAWFKTHKRDHGKWVEKNPDEPEVNDVETELAN